MAKAVVSRGRKHRIERDPAWAPGRYEATFTIHDQHYHDGAEWQPVNESLVNDGADGYAKKCDTTQHVIRLGNGGTRRWYPRRDVSTEYVSITEIEYWRTTGGGSWRALNLPTPVWRGNGADWDLSNLSASFTNTWRRLKTSFVLKDATAPTRLRFAVTLTGLTLGADWRLRNSGNEVVGWIDPPTADDANGAAVPVTATYAGGWIEWSVTVGSATYPIEVDPTFTDGYGGDTTTAADTYIGSNDTDRSFGAASNLSFNDGEQCALLRFILSGISSSATCDSATLSLYHYTAGTTNAWTLNAYHISDANGDWIEGSSSNPATDNSPTWDKKAQTGTGTGTDWAGSDGCETSGTDYNGTSLANVSGNRADVAGTEYQFSLTPSVVQGWFGDATNNGIVIKMTSSSLTDGNFGSSENGADGTYRPKLVVTYTTAVALAGAAASAAWTIATQTLVAGAVALSGAAASGTWTVPTQTLGATAALSGTAAVATWTVPEQSLSSGTPLTGSAAVGTWTVPTQTLAPGSVALSGTAATSTWTVPTQTLGAGSVALSGTAATATWTVPTQTLAPGTVALSGTAGAATWTVPTQTLSLGAVALSGSAATSTWTVPTHTLYGGVSYTVVEMANESLRHAAVVADRLTAAQLTREALTWARITGDRL